MISVEEAAGIILDHPLDLPNEVVALRKSLQRALAQNIIADRDFPPFDRVTMDGIAIVFENFKKGQREFPVEGMAVAGATRKSLSSKSNCLEVMTGAPLPLGCNSVIRYEDIELQNGSAIIVIDGIKEWQNIHKQGLDQKQGDLIVKPGVRITAAEIGVAATVGSHELEVKRKPDFCIVSTGDELVEPDEIPEAHQIRMSNSYSIAHFLESKGAECDLFHIADDQSRLMSDLGELLEKYDALILSGGVSKGKLDFVPEVLVELGCRKLFHRVAQRPGKPFWFGVAGNKRQSPIFALPGNPVSAMACTARYVIPWMEKSLGLVPERRFVKLAKDVHFKPDLTLFQQAVASTGDDGGHYAVPKLGQGSGDLASLVGANGFIELPKGRDTYHAGESYSWWPWSDRV